MTRARAIEWRLVVAAVFLAVYAALLFTRLGHYPLWDDEANTALFGESVWRTGDTYALRDGNVIAYRNALELDGLHNRYIPPLQYYLCAPFVGLVGGSAFAARFPFALAGLAGAAVLVWWMWRRGRPLREWILFAVGMTANVGLLLFLRQCRYYGPVVLLSVLAAYFYVERDGGPRRVVGLCVSGALLVATQYLAFAGLGAAIAVDYLVAGRRERPYSWRQLAAIAGSQLAAAALVVSIWFPLGKTPGQPGSWLLNKLHLAGWQLRDLDAGELAVGLLLLAAPALYLARRSRDAVLLRGPLAVLAYAVTVAVFSPQWVSDHGFADVRYLIALVPLCVWIGVRVIDALPAPSGVKVVVAVAVFGTTAGQWALQAALRSEYRPPLRSTLGAFARELRDPPVSPYRAAADWVNAFVRPGESVYVVPEHGMYPLMFHAPHPVYAWQLNRGMEQRYPMLPPIHFKLKEYPRFMIGFGEDAANFLPVLPRMAEHGIVYRPVAFLPVYGKDLTRPELFLRSFEPVGMTDPEIEGVWIVRRDGAGGGPGVPDPRAPPGP